MRLQRFIQGTLLFGLLALAAPGGALAQRYDGSSVVSVGVFGQGTWLDFGVSQPVTGTASPSGFAGGVTAGYDFHLPGHWLLGILADVAVGDARSTFAGVDYGHDYFATLRGRFGVYARPDVLLYGSVGVGFLGFEADEVGTTAKASETLTGIAAGAGIEVDWHHVILYGEYVYGGFGDRQFTLSGVRHETDADLHAVRLGIKFKVGHDYYHGVGRHYEPLK